MTLRHGRSVVAVAELASTPWRRGVGLIGRREMQEPSGLLIQPCSSVHTWFMRFPIDVVYLDRDFAIVKVVADLKPWRFSLGGRRARFALELPAGQAEQHGLRPGDRLQAVDP
jgi:uncharacterized protein